MDADTKAKVRADHLQVADLSRLTTSQGRGHASIAISLDTYGGIALRGRNPRVMGHLSPNHQWDVHKCNFLPPYPHHGSRETVLVAGRCTWPYFFVVKPDGPG